MGRLRCLASNLGCAVDLRAKSGKPLGPLPHRNDSRPRRPAISNADRPGLTSRLEALGGGTGLTGDAPGGPSRWATEQSAAWPALRPELVVEVSYGQVTDGKFRHGTMLLRWRPDKAPAQCIREQIGEE